MAIEKEHTNNNRKEHRKGKTSKLTRKDIYKQVASQNKNRVTTRTSSVQKTKEETSWGNVSSWYDGHLQEADTYHAKVLLPNLLRNVGEIAGKTILDLGCGQGYFSRAFLEGGARVFGVDISKELIALAEDAPRALGKDTSVKKVTYFVSGADDLYMIKDASCDVVICVLALQNIENISGVFKEVSRVLKKNGRFLFILNHPAFRIPKESEWGYDEDAKIQFRRINSYLSESKVKIDMTPGSLKDKRYTISFHRPLQLWSKILHKHHFVIARMEEWESHRKSEKGPRQYAEDIARKEIPLFLFIEAVNMV